MSTPQKTILIVEDQKLLINMVTEVLSKNGYHVEQAFNGQEGLEKALSIHPDLILLDIIMPVMDGITMLQKLRLDSWGQNAKVVILSNLTQSTKLEEAQHEKVLEYLVKSDWDLKDICKLCDEILAN